MWQRIIRMSGELIFEGDFLSIEDCVVAAVAQDISLQSAFLAGLDLHNRTLTRADFRNARLRRTNFRGANLQNVCFFGADIAEVDFRDTDLRTVTGISKQPSDLILVPEGTLIGWKKCRADVIVKLEIPAEAKRVNSTTRKCRAEFVRVLEVFGAECGATYGVSMHHSGMLYRVGEIVRCDKWNPDWKTECGGGIHFFITRQEAEEF